MVSKNLVVTDDVDSPRFQSDSLLIPEGHFEDVAWMPLGRMKAELARQVWGSKYFYPIVNDVFDTTLQEAMELWDEVDKLAAYARKNGLKSRG